MTGCEIRITSGGPADLPAAMAVMDDSFDPSFGESWTSAQFAGLLPLPGVWLRLAWQDGQVVGFALNRSVGDEAELLLLAVRSEAQGRGIGAALLDAFMADSRKKGVTRLHLEVRDGNRAIKLYERAGFEIVGRRRNYYSGEAGPYDALTLAKITED